MNKIKKKEINEYKITFWFLFGMGWLIIISFYWGG